MSNYISIQSSNDVIEHFGTKGMRWGHRKSKEFYTKKYINKGYHPRHAREMAQRKMVLNKRLKKGAKIVVDHQYRKARKAYNDYIKK